MRRLGDKSKISPHCPNLCISGACNRWACVLCILRAYIVWACVLQARCHRRLYYEHVTDIHLTSVHVTGAYPMSLFLVDVCIIGHRMSGTYTSWACISNDALRTVSGAKSSDKGVIAPRSAMISNGECDALPHPKGSEPLPPISKATLATSYTCDDLPSSFVDFQQLPLKKLLSLVTHVTPKLSRYKSDHRMSHNLFHCLHDVHPVHR
jgi:hypothetical protein